MSQLCMGSKRSSLSASLQGTVTWYLHSCPVLQNHPAAFKSGKVQQLPPRLWGQQAYNLSSSESLSRWKAFWGIFGFVLTGA